MGRRWQLYRMISVDDETNKRYREEAKRPIDFEKLGFGDEDMRNAFITLVEKGPERKKTPWTTSQDGIYKSMETEHGVKILQHKTRETCYVEKDDLQIWIFKDAVRLIFDQGVFMFGGERYISEDDAKLFWYAENAHRFPPDMLFMPKNHTLSRFPPLYHYVVALCIKKKIPSKYAAKVLFETPKAVYQIARKIGLTFDYANKFAHIRGAYAESAEWNKKEKERRYATKVIVPYEERFAHQNHKKTPNRPT